VTKAAAAFSRRRIEAGRIAFVQRHDLRDIRRIAIALRSG
jgi:hypothetical protein